MSHPTRNSTNPPDYYHHLTAKQKRNWRRTTKRIERNEELRAKYPPFHSLSEVEIVHVHQHTPIDVINELIIKANRTHRYTVDTESELSGRGALVQIEMVHTINQSTVLLCEVAYFPERNSILYEKVNELISIVFSESNEILSWGSLEDEFNNFTEFEMFKTGKVRMKKDMQFLFSRWNADRTSHPERERREGETRRSAIDWFETPDEQEGSESQDGMDIDGLKIDRQPISLQDAVASTFKSFLDKSETINRWRCGLDLALNTWKTRWFTKHGYSQGEEKEKRSRMRDYAVNDCLAVTRLYFHMDAGNSDTTDSQRTQVMEGLTIDGVVDNTRNDFEKINFPWFAKPERWILGDDPCLRAIKFPYFNNPTPRSPVDDDTNILIVGTTDEEMVDLEDPVQLNLPVDQEQQETTAKRERQKRKNEKLKWKKKHLPSFQNKIRRPIYNRYDYRKIRAQLKIDHVLTSHQITIDRHRREVLIGYKSREELERAMETISIDYFSKEQYFNRWGRTEEEQRRTTTMDEHRRTTTMDEQRRTTTMDEQQRRMTNHVVDRTIDKQPNER